MSVILCVYELVKMMWECCNDCVVQECFVLKEPRQLWLRKAFIDQIQRPNKGNISPCSAFSFLNKYYFQAEVLNLYAAARTILLEDG